MPLSLFGYDAPLWQDIGVLAGIERPRHATVPIERMPYQPDGRHDAHVVLATEEILSRAFYRKAMHETIGRWCGFGPGSHWDSQSPFFHALMQSFFSSDGDMPGWLTVFPQRVTARFRQSHGRSLTQKAERPVIQQAGEQLERHQLKLGSVNIRPESLAMATRPDIGLSETRLVTQKIRRGLPYQPGETPRFTLEVWTYLFTPGLDDDDASAGKIPAMQGAGLFYEGIGILNAPHITLGKLLAHQTKAEFLSFNLHPEGGMVLDLRSMFYELPYFLISDSNNHSLLRSIVTPGHWEVF
ncbi:hypothetical protein [Tautonia marina]|uniref:hypothetical protein n=1 Tax=Tautonia marina TaxID=2653855 RepID=UPI001260EF5D|nr:hypothetical protein [Tautonia marina]